MMVSPPLVSVVIPCYNAEKYMHEAIDSIIDQSYTNLEIILINDGSADHTEAICREYENKDKRIKYFTNTVNQGLIYTLNKGMFIANGEFIARMDADDRSDLSRIEKQVNFLNDNSVIDIVGTLSEPITSAGESAKRFQHVYFESSTLKVSSYFCNPLTHGTVLGKAAVLKSNLYDENYKHSEDFELWLRLVSRGYKIANLKDRLYYYRINEDGVSFKHEKTQIKSHNKASKNYLSQVLGAVLNDNHVSILNYRGISENISFKDFRTSYRFFINITKDCKTKELLNFKATHIHFMALQSMIRMKKLSLEFLKIVTFCLINHNFWRGVYRARLK